MARLVRNLIEFKGWRIAVLVGLMVVAALSEGLGLLLIIPLLSFSGSTGAVAGNSAHGEAIRDVVSRLGFSFSFEAVLTIFVVIVIVRQLVVYFGARLAADTRIEFVSSVRKELFASLGDASWRFLSGDRLDQVGQVLLVDGWRVGEAALHLIRILSGLILLAANVVVAVWVSPIVATAILGSVALLTLLFSNRIARVQQHGREISDFQNNVYRVVENYLDNIRTAKMSGATRGMQSSFVTAIDGLNDRLSRFVRDSEFIRMSLLVSGAVAIAIALLFAVNVMHITGPELLLLVFITARFIPRISAVNQDLHRMMHELPAYEHAMSILADSRAHPDAISDQLAVSRPERNVAVQGVVVMFGEGQEQPVLDGVSLNIDVGEMVAITGSSGIGKSTLADVVAGLLLPDLGEILVDDSPLDRKSWGNWRHQVGYVSQSAGMLQATVEENLNWVNEEAACSEDLRSALRCAELFDVVYRLPDGLDTVIDRREGRLSSGERQRLAIARELLRKPNLLILDEATNALDVETEMRVISNLRRLYPKLSLLVIAHRQSAIDMADRVFDLGELQRA